MPKIRVLDNDTINKIAAGEVVERPASVVKELIENAVDAKSKDITVKFVNSGKKSVVVEDNGTGMDRDDAILSLKRHATSKISSAGDLFSIHSLGFRGEALPSIAAVSHLSITTRVGSNDAGWYVEVDNGNIVSAHETGTAVGTRVEVRDLFKNIPARLKFMKSDFTERGHIINAVTELALAYPETGFKLYDGKDEVLNCAPVKGMAQRIADIIGIRVMDELFYLQLKQNGGYSLSGYLSKPSFVRRAKPYQYLFINSRVVRSRMVTQAVYDAYRKTLEINEHPVFLLYLNADPSCVDVNVHPAKREVKFKDEREVYEFVFSEVSRSLANPKTVIAEFHAENISSGEKNGSSIGEEDAVRVTQPEVSVQEEFIKQTFIAADLLKWDITPLGQVGKLFIIAEYDGGVMIIDQHAAEERVKYERFMADYNSKQIAVQQLLTPIVFEFTVYQAGVVEEFNNIFAALGFDVEPFGGKSYVLKSLPAILDDGFGQKSFLEVLDTLSDSGLQQQSAGEAKVSKVYDKIIRSACRASVKAHDHMSLQEMRKLVADLKHCKMPYVCAHGRPTLVTLSYKELEQKFVRKK
ncbi:MAG: DNA mismatch repair endonuclease MutL [Elusimicrobiota bacterium]